MPPVGSLQGCGSVVGSPTRSGDSRCCLRRSSTPRSGAGPRTRRSRHSSRASARRALVTPCRAVGTFTTLDPWTQSCGSAATRSKPRRPHSGFCTYTASVRPRDARLTASAMPIERRPQPIRRRGQGGASTSPQGSSAESGTGNRPPGSQAQGRRTTMHFSWTGSPTASASPSAWLRIPASPVVRTQVRSGRDIGKQDWSGASRRGGRIAGSRCPLARDRWE